MVGYAKACTAALRNNQTTQSLKDTSTQITNNSLAENVLKVFRNGEESKRPAAGQEDWLNETAYRADFTWQRYGTVAYVVARWSTLHDCTTAHTHTHTQYRNVTALQYPVIQWIWSWSISHAQTQTCDTRSGALEHWHHHNLGVVLYLTPWYIQHVSDCGTDTASSSSFCCCLDVSRTCLHNPLFLRPSVDVLMALWSYTLRLIFQKVSDCSYLRDFFLDGPRARRAHRDVSSADYKYDSCSDGVFRRLSFDFFEV